MSNIFCIHLQIFNEVMLVTYNISRLDYVLSLFGMTKADLLMRINEGHKNIFTEKDVFTPSIDFNLLKRIDNVFKKGINYYLDPENIEKSENSSIFFRKQNFAVPLNFGARVVINRYEDLKFSLSAISEMSDVCMDRSLKSYNIADDPHKVAFQLRRLLYPNFSRDKRKFLKSLIEKLAGYNILVFEFIETHKKRDKANIDGFFLKPNFIVLKRQNYSREIFTLAHEVGHYLIDKEEADNLEDNRLFLDRSKFEKWCNDFAFSFLAGDNASIIDNLSFASPENDYHNEKICDISQRTNLSTLAIFTRLLSIRKISFAAYLQIQHDINDSVGKYEEDKERFKQLDSRFGSTPRPILSPLLVSTLQSAFYSGVINEYDFCHILKINAKELGTYLQ